MALSTSYKQELIDQLKECALLADKSNRYKVVYKNYKELKEKINLILKNIDYIPFEDCENYLKNINKLKIFEFNIKLLNLFDELKNLKLELESFGWENDVANSIEMILVFGKLKDMEKEIKSEFGKKIGERIIYEAKCEALKFEQEMGLSFYEEDVNKYEDLDIYLNSIRVLHKIFDQIKITKNDNLIEEYITLTNINGKNLNFKKLAQVEYNGNIYIDVKYLDKTKDEDNYEFYLYKVEFNENVQMFILEEDDKIIDEIYDKIERLEISTIINK